jgi:hypothetical protein
VASRFAAAHSAIQTPPATNVTHRNLGNGRPDATESLAIGFTGVVLVSASASAG